MYFISELTRIPRQALTEESANQRQKFEHLFFTGSQRLGYKKLVKAVKKLIEN